MTRLVIQFMLQKGWINDYYYYYYYYYESDSGNEGNEKKQEENVCLRTPVETP